jgi:hypothetical protein
MAKSLYGVIGRYSSGEALLDAAKIVKGKGYQNVEAYTPYMVEGVVDTLKNRDDNVTWIVFFGGVIGAGLGFLLQVYVSVIDYPMNVGGRPDFSWPSFIPVTFECGILSAALSGLVGMLGLNGLPRPHHPIFEAPGIEASGRDKFFLCIEADDPGFEIEEVKETLRSTGAESVDEVMSE